MTPESIQAQWSKRWAEIQEQRAKQSGKGKGKADPSPWVPYADLELAVQHIRRLVEVVSTQADLLNEAMAQLGAVSEQHRKEIENLNIQHALTIQKYMRGI